jgi:hypothetical protein
VRTFFVVNAWRTGSTLLATMLGVHRRIVTLIEGRWFVNVSWRLKRLQAIPRSRRAELMYECVRTAQRLDRLGTPPRVLREIVLKQLDDPDGILPALMAEFAARTKPSADVWGEKSCQHSLYIKQVDDLFPDARFIYLARDPRATVYSIAKPSFPYFSDDWGVAAHIYRRFNEQIERDLARIPPGRQLWLAYEDLVSNPREELRRCCDFLGVEFDPAMLRHEVFKHDLTGLGSEKAAYSVTAAFVDEWKRGLTPTQVRCVERFTAHLRLASRYPPANPPAQPVRVAIAFGILRAKHLCLRLAETLVQKTIWRRPFVWWRLGTHARGMCSSLSRSVRGRVRRFRALVAVRAASP